jgi:hypothetical protein
LSVIENIVESEGIKVELQLSKWLQEKQMTAFEVTYQGKTKTLQEWTRGISLRDKARLGPEERIILERQPGPIAWQSVLAGTSGRARLAGAAENEAIFPGSFDPLHDAHRAMARIGARITGLPVAYELSIRNVEKPALDFVEIAARADRFDGAAAWLTSAATVWSLRRQLRDFQADVAIDMQGLLKGQVEVHRPGGKPSDPPEAPEVTLDGQGLHSGRLHRSRPQAGPLAEPAAAAPEEVLLVHALVGAASLEPIGPISAEQQQGDGAMVGLHAGGQQLGHGRSRRGDHGSG